MAPHRLTLALSSSLWLAALAPCQAKEELADRPDALIQRCESCHGTGGNSEAPATPRLNGQLPGYILARLADFRDVNRETPHAAFNMWHVAFQLSDSEKRKIAAYFGAQPATPAKPGPLADAGRRIYEQGVPSRAMACQLCHGPQGKGHGITARLAGQHAAYLQTQLSQFNLQMRKNDLMHPDTERLTNEQIDALASYLAGD
jgi:cytochrome c553